MSIQFEGDLGRLAGEIMADRARRAQMIRAIVGGSLAVLGAARRQMIEANGQLRALAETTRRQRRDHELARVESDRRRSEARQEAMSRLQAEMAGARHAVRSHFGSARRAWSRLGEHGAHAEPAMLDHEIRHRVLMLISSHPAGLTERELERRLGIDHDRLGPLLAAMETEASLHREGAVYFPDR